MNDTPAEPASTKHPVERVGGWGCLVELCGAALGCGLLFTADDERVPTAALVTLLVLLVKGAGDVLTHRVRAPLYPVATAAPALVIAGLVHLAAWDSLATQVETLKKTRMYEPFSLLLLALSSPIIALFWLVLWRGGAFLAALALRSSKGRVVMQAARGAAVLMSALLVLLIVFALRGTLSRPSIDRYLRDLYARGVPLRIEGVTRPREAWYPGHPGYTPKQYQTTVDGLTVVHTCDVRRSCLVRIFDDPSAVDARAEDPETGPFLWDHAELLVMRDQPDVVLLQATWRESWFAADEKRSIDAFRRVGNKWKHESLPIESVIRRTSAPIPWFACAGAGAVLVLALWVTRRRAARCSQDLEAESTPPTAPPFGPSAGTLDDLPATNHALLRIDATIVVVASLSAAPLAAAARVGLLHW